MLRSGALIECHVSATFSGRPLSCPGLLWALCASLHPVQYTLSPRILGSARRCLLLLVVRRLHAMFFLGLRPRQASVPSPEGKWRCEQSMRMRRDAPCPLLDTNARVRGSQDTSAKETFALARALLIVARQWPLVTHWSERSRICRDRTLASTSR